jgi:hypothetical protein
MIGDTFVIDAVVHGYNLSGIVNLMKKARRIGRMLDHFHDQSR